MQPPTGTRRVVPTREQSLIGDLTSGFAPALLDRKTPYRAHAISRVAKRIKRFRQAKSQRADNACSHNCHAHSGLFGVRTVWLGHVQSDKVLQDFLLLSYDKHLTNEPKRKPKPGSWWIVS